MCGGETRLVVLLQVKAVEDEEGKTTSQNNIQINRIFIFKILIRIFICPN